MSRELFDDDYDPLAPPPTEDVAAPEADHVDRFGPGAEPDDADLEMGSVDDGGIGDSDGIVRLWFTDDGSLEKVRLSPVWFRKLDSGAKLAEVFRQAFLTHKIRSVGVAKAAPEERPVPTLVDVPEYTPENAAIIHAMIEHNLARMGEAASALDAQGPPPAPKPVEVRVDGVTVALDAGGHPKSVQFDERWLDHTSVGAICSTVLAATRRAQDQHQLAPVPDTTELEELRAEHDLLLEGLHRMMNPEEDQR